LVLRAAIGGTLMGLANLVPGISGGTMLLAAGVYPAFISGIAELTTLRFRMPSLLLLGSVATTAALAILLLAGTVKGLVQDHRWIMYSLFIGLTLGGVPLIWRMTRPASPAVFVAAVATFGLMVLMALSGATAGGSGERNLLLLSASGVAASSAMILPGVSGGYLLLLLGQYEPILGTIDQIKRGLLGDAATGVGPDLALILDAMEVVVPLGLGVVVGIVGVSNLLRWLLDRYEKATLGALLGLLLGAVVGLWPFQEGRPPEPGELLKGQLVTEESAASFDVDDWPVTRFDPSGGQLAAALGLIGAGLAATALIGRLGGGEPDADPE
ncbi:MAG: undecaprenyl phosphate translocase family protein, partial [Planctomycetota bacterium]